MGCGFALHAVSICLGGWLFGPLTIFLSYVICLTTLEFSAVGMLKNIVLILLFGILSLITCPMPIQRILCMLLCQKTSSLAMWEWWNAYNLHPHRSWLAGIAPKMSSFALKLAWGLFQKYFTDPIDLLAAASLLVML